MRNVLAAEFTMGDSEDPGLYAAEPILNWQATPKGKWFMEHAHDPTFYINNDPNFFGHRISIYGQLTEQDEIIFRLQWGAD